MPCSFCFQAYPFSNMCMTHNDFDCPDMRNPNSLPNRCGVSHQYTVTINPYGFGQATIQQINQPTTTVQNCSWCPYHRQNMNNIFVCGQLRCSKYHEH